MWWIPKPWKYKKSVFKSTVEQNNAVQNGESSLEGTVGESDNKWEEEKEE